MVRSVKLASSMLGTAALAGTLAFGLTAAAGTSPANASGAVTESVSQTNTMISPTCYNEVRRSVTYYTHHAGKGWVHEPAPKVTTTYSTHCYSR